MKLKFLLLTAAAAGLVFAQGPRPHGNFGPGGLNGGGAGPDLENHLTRTLNLSSAQQSTVHAAIQEHRVATQGMGEQMHTLQTSLHDAIKSGAADQIDKITAQIGTLHQQQLASQAKAASKIYSALTPDQKTQIGDHLEMLMGGPGFGRGPGANAANRSKAASN